MTPERWQKVAALFQSALVRPAAERRTFLQEVCGEDPALRREVESLLAAHEQVDDFLAEPALAPAETRVAESAAASVAERRRRQWPSGGQELFHPLAFSPDGQILATATASVDRAVKLWDVAKRRELVTLRGHTERQYPGHWEHRSHPKAVDRRYGYGGIRTAQGARPPMSHYEANEILTYFLTHALV